MTRKTILDSVRERAASRNGRAHDQPGEAAPPPPPNTFTADALMRMQLPPPRWAVDGIVPEGLNVLAGKPKLGKSWLVLHLALAVSAGGVALGRTKVVGGSVLYISLEDTKRRLQSRIRKLLGPDEQPSPRLHLAHDWPRMDRGGLDAIIEWIEAHPDARLIIFDTWARFRPVRLGKADNYEIDYADGGQVKAIADKYGVSILIVHHCRKMGASDPLEEVSGSVGLTGACDGVLVLRRERGQHAATLMVTGRDVDEAELALAFDKEHCLWQLMGEAEEFRLSKERQDVIALLMEAKRPLTPSEAAPLLQKTTNATKKLLWRMDTDGQIKAIGSGKYALMQEPEEPRNRGTAGTGTVPPDAGTEEPERNRDDPFETPWG